MFWVSPRCQLVVAGFFFFFFKRQYFLERLSLEGEAVGNFVICRLDTLTSALASVCAEGPHLWYPVLRGSRNPNQCDSA